MLFLRVFFLSIITCAGQATPIPDSDFAKRFQGFDACFMLYDVAQDKLISEYNPNNRCQEQISPDSTFKIALSLMAFDHGAITQNTVFKWDGQVREFADWNQDLTPKTWLQYSSVWVSQLLTPILGYPTIKKYLAEFHYGNQNFSGDPGKNNGLTYAWLASSLKISAVEQLHFLKTVLTGKLTLENNAVAYTKENMYLGKLANNFAYYGKTGSGRHGRNERMTNPSRLRDGWFVGFIENGTQRYIFVANLTDKTTPKDKLYGSMVLKPIVIQILNDYFS